MRETVSTVPTVPTVPVPHNGAESRLPVPSVETPAERHPVACYLARLAPGSRRAQAGALERIAELLSGGSVGPVELPWERLEYAHVQALRSMLAERYAPATANRYLAALRGVLRESWRLGRIDAERLERLSDVAPIRGSRLPAGRSLDRLELLALFDACAADASPGGARDAALIALLYGCGLRRSETVGLDLTDYDPGAGSLRVRAGKGRKERQGYVPGGAREALAAWLDARGDVQGPLLWPVLKGGRMEPRRMSDQAVYGALKRRARQAGLADFSPHDLRRSHVGDLLDAGADLAAVQGLAGHASPTTTARYDRRGNRARKAAAERLAVPYNTRKG